ncbi:MAG: disulfide reductase [Candidatus Thorarchaeota archaeon]|nr:MAG: disulfide reductase [Candidatus Thorarchaeota archaeon]
MTSTLEDLRMINARCIHCRACQYAYSGEPDREGQTEEYTGMIQGCPAGLYYGWEGYFNSGKQWIARAFLNNEIKPSKELLEVVEACTTCGNCETQCENRIDTVSVTEALRAAIIEAGIEPLAKHKKFGEMVGNDLLRNPYNEPREKRTDWFAGAKDRKDVKVAYFVGCTGAYRQQHIAKHTASLLKKLGIDFTVLTSEVCCGSPMLRTGQKAIFEDVMRKNIELFKNYETVVFSCAGCFKTFRNDYPRISGKPLPFKVQHTMELVRDNIRSGKLKITKPYSKTVTWHDPCHSIRHVGIAIEKDILSRSNNWLTDARTAEKAKEAWFELPREVMKAIPALQLKEMYRVKGDSFCCGAGGGVKAQFPDMALATAKERLKEAASTGAQVLLTSCPFCVTNLSDGIKALKEEEALSHKKLPGSDLEVVELLQLLDQLI